MEGDDEVLQVEREMQEISRRPRLGTLVIGEGLLDDYSDPRVRLFKPPPQQQQLEYESKALEDSGGGDARLGTLAIGEGVVVNHPRIRPYMPLAHRQTLGHDIPFRAKITEDFDRPPVNVRVQHCFNLVYYVHTPYN